MSSIRDPRAILLVSEARNAAERILVDATELFGSARLEAVDRVLAGLERSATEVVCLIADLDVGPLARRGLVVEVVPADPCLHGLPHARAALYRAAKLALIHRKWDPAKVIVAA